MDLFVVPTIGFDLLYALIIVRLARRELVWVNVTAHPTAEWIARQITEAFPWNEAPRYLIRDRDGIYGTVVSRRLRAMGIRDKPIAAGSPWQNCFAERLIGSIRRECVDHLVVLGEQHLRRVLHSYALYYNETRTHRSLNKDAPVSRPIQRIGRIASRALVGFPVSKTVIIPPAKHGIGPDGEAVAGGLKQSTPLDFVLERFALDLGALQHGVGMAECIGKRGVREIVEFGMW